MEQSGGKNGIGRFKAVPRELTYGLVHLPRSIEQKLRINEKEAQDFIMRLKNILPQMNPYFSSRDNSIAAHHITSGFYSACYGFESSTGKWVIKVGHDKSPMKTQFHPSSQEYADSYSKNLEIQRTIFKDKLPHLIPEPQGAFFVQGEHRSTTVVIQPLVEYVSSFDRKINLSQEERTQLGNEFDLLQSLMVKMRKEYEIMPDFMRAGGKKGHLVVVRKQDGVHLVMLDNGVFDEKGDRTPALHFVNTLITEKGVKKQKRELKK